MATRRKQTKSAEHPVSLDWMSAAPRAFIAQTAQAALLGLDAFEANLHIWRAAGAAMSKMGERQQDAVLKRLRTRLLATTAAPSRPADLADQSTAGA